MLNGIIFAFVLWQTRGLLSAVVDHPEIEVSEGMYFNITCSLTTEQELSLCTSDQMYFQVGQDKPNVQRISNTTILLERRNATPHEHQDYNCMCQTQEKGLGTVLAKSSVAVGTAPLPVPKFNCLHYDFDHMNCEFSLPDNNLRTNYNLSYWTNRSHISEKIDIGDGCTYKKGLRVMCVLNAKTPSWEPQKYDEVIHFELRQSNKLGDIRQIFNVSDYESLVPAKPGQELETLNKTANSICWSWKMKVRSNYNEELLWQLRIQPNISYTSRRSKAIDTDILCLYDLPYANYLYKLKLRARLNAAESIFSEPLELSFYTASERPRRPPKVTSGGFFVYSSETQLRLYWEQLQPHEFNGPNFTYVISEYRKNGKDESAAQIQVESNSALIKNWNKDDNHELLLRSKNDVGDSIEASRLIIPAITDADFNLRVPKNIRSVYNSNNSSYTLFWEAPQDIAGLLNYTVFWCNAKPALQSECEGSIHFQNVNGAQRFFTTAPGQTAYLNMAVSANFKRFNTGMHWVICIRDVTDDLAKMEPTIDAATNSSLTVNWSTERVCPVILAGYNMTYCQHPPLQPDNCTTVVIRDRYAKHYTIHDLQPYTDYSIKMLMFSETKASKYSIEKIQRTAEASPTAPRQLQFGNLTSSSVTLSWKPPLKANGVVRTYEGVLKHDNKEQYFRLPISSDKLVDKERRVYYKLTNLNAYKHYSVHVRARTQYSSIEHSNVVEFRTSVGVPSTPTLHSFTTKDDYTTLKWSPPQQPAGRIDFYELVVSEHTKNREVSRNISYIMAGQKLSCVLANPKCTPLHNFQYQVRAVNVERLQQSKNMTEIKLKADAAIANAPQLCVSELPLSAEDYQLINDYKNEQHYRQLWSEWSSYGFSCSSDNSWISVLLIIGVVMIIGFAYYYVYEKYRTMSDLKVELPVGIEDSLTFKFKADTSAGQLMIVESNGGNINSNSGNSNSSNSHSGNNNISDSGNYSRTMTIDNGGYTRPRPRPRSTTQEQLIELTISNANILPNSASEQFATPINDQQATAETAVAAAAPARASSGYVDISDLLNQNHSPPARAPPVSTCSGYTTMEELELGIIRRH